ncbi:hypothetical protein ACJ72_02667 [Emergomyces africanus]|uniref:Uncharacterized protein n=1 Tax=Emergomyces africanus TaxID=1955775 RepID=A0A1B7P2B2_9EURO|nr:hypothetical protein ACJ72_02667 [Emergomyces africanus]
MSIAENYAITDIMIELDQRQVLTSLLSSHVLTCEIVVVASIAARSENKSRGSISALTSFALPWPPHKSSRSNNNSTPSSSWLAFWGILKTGIAVIIGCLPALAIAIIYRKERATRRTYGKGYSSMESQLNKNSIPLSNPSSGANKSLVQRGGYDSAPAPTIAKTKGISLTQSVQVRCPSSQLI